MADKWMDERDRRWRERDWRRSEDAGRGEPGAEQSYGGRDTEARSFDSDEQEFAAKRSGPGRDRVFGEQETGASYSRGAGPAAGQPSGYRGQDYRSRQGSYGGTSSGRGQDRDELERNRSGGRSPRFGAQDYTQGGRFYGDDDRARIYREEYGQGGVEYGPVPGGYDAQRQGAQSYGAQGNGGQPNGGQANGGHGNGGGQGYGGTYGGAGGDYGYRARPAYGGTASGGTGGYDFERGYGDGGRDASHGERWEDRSGEAVGRAGDFLQRAGQRVANWFRGDDLMEGERSYQTDFGRERRYEDRGHRGLGPKGYKRSDERIHEEVAQRLTDDAWLDASNIEIQVSDGEVTLTGTVENREAKHRAERIVEEISGVGHVQNNLRPDRGNMLTGSGRGFGDSVVESQLRKDDPAANGSGGSAGTTPGANGADEEL